jgi:hypothetical protein
MTPKAGACTPEQLAPIGEIVGWRFDVEARETIDGLLEEIITDPVGPEFMAPPARGPQKVA